MWIIFILMDNYFLLWVKCCTIIINFIAQIVPAVAIRSSFKMAPVPFRQVPSSPFSRFILYISCPRLKSINFLRNFGSYVYVDVLSSLLSTSHGRAVGVSRRRSASLCSCEGLLSLLWPFLLFQI